MCPPTSCTHACSRHRHIKPTATSTGVHTAAVGPNTHMRIISTRGFLAKPQRPSASLTPHLILHESTNVDLYIHVHLIYISICAPYIYLYTCMYAYIYLNMHTDRCVCTASKQKNWTTKGKPQESAAGNPQKHREASRLGAHKTHDPQPPSKTHTCCCCYRCCVGARQRKAVRLALGGGTHACMRASPDACMRLQQERAAPSSCIV